MKNLGEAILSFRETGDPVRDQILTESAQSITDEVMGDDYAQEVQEVLESNIGNTVPGLMDSLKRQAFEHDDLLIREAALRMLGAIKLGFAAGVIVGIEMEKP